MNEHDDVSIHSDDNVSDIVDQSDMDTSYNTNNNSDLTNGNTSLSQLST